MDTQNDLFTQNCKALQVTITELPQAEAGQVLLQWKVKNTSNRTVKFHRFMTPIEGFYGNFLSVNDETGEKVRYAGIMKKRSKPGLKDLETLPGGEEIEVEFDLLLPYPLTKAGKYTIQFKGNKKMNQLPDSEMLEIDVIMN